MRRSWIEQVGEHLRRLLDGDHASVHPETEHIDEKSGPVAARVFQVGRIRLDVRRLVGRDEAAALQRDLKRLSMMSA